MIPLLSKDFTLPADGWYQLTPEGEFLHKPTGILQVVDTAACEAIVSDFTARAAAPDFGGVLVDYDHFSMDPERPSEAAGWIMETQHRPGSGVWARIRWTDEGEKAVTGGRYRYMSPVWMPADCETLAPDKLRPLRLKNAALTNAPNIVGAAPLSNDVRIDAPPHIAAFLANRALGALTNALTPGHTAQRRAFFAKLRGSPTAAADKTPTGRPAEQPARPAVNPLRQTIPGDTTLPVDDGRRVPGVPENAIPVNPKKPAQPARPGGAYPMPIVGPGRPTPGRPGDIWIGGSPDFDERTGRYRNPNDPRNGKLGLPTIRPGASIGDRIRQLFANRVMTDAQRRAMFARLRSGSGPNPRDYEPRTPAEVDQDAEAERELTAGEREQNLALSRIIARRKAIEADNARNKPELAGDAEARRRAAGVGVAKKAGPEQDGIQAKAKGKQVARVDMPVDPDRKPNPNSLTAGRGLQWRGPVAQTAAGRRAEEEGRQRAVRDWLRDLISRGALHNRSPMSDEQRKAMFARMDYQGRGAPDPVPAAPGVPAQGDPASSTPAAAMVRQNQARLDALYTQRTNLEAQAPKRPDPTVPDLAEVDPRAARQAALAAGGDATAVLQAEQAAREQNQKAGQWRTEMERTLTARGVRPEALNAAIQRELDKMAGADAKAMKDYEKAQDRHLKALAAIDAKIASEEIAGQEAELRHRNAAVEVQTRTAAAAEKAAAAAAAKAAADKAKAEAAAAKARAGDPDPVKQVAAVKKQRTAYLDAIVLGELDVAERLAPGVNHRANIAAVRAMIPRLGQPMSTRDRASAAEALRILAQTAPDAYPRTK